MMLLLIAECRLVRGSATFWLCNCCLLVVHRHATDSCYDVANRCLQMLGGYGYLKDYPVSAA